MRSLMPQPEPDAMLIDRGGQEPETPQEAEADGPDAQWAFWQQEISAALKVEERFRKEGELCEREVFGPDGTFDTWPKDQAHLIQSTIETLKPNIYSETPEPICMRTFRGDGEEAPVERIGAEVMQRLAQQLVKRCAFDAAMEAARDDWLTVGRGAVRVMYSATWQAFTQMQPNALGVYEEVEEQRKTDERVYVRHWPWRRMVVGAAPNTHDVHFKAYLSFLNRDAFTKRFGVDLAGRTSFAHAGKAKTAGTDAAEDESGSEWMADGTDTTLPSRPTASSRDQAAVWEIHDKRDRTVKWWSPDHNGGLLDTEPDPLGIKDFWDTPPLLLASTRSDSIAPRSRIAYMKARAEEVDIATRKLNAILRKLAVVGLYPGSENELLRTALNGESKLIAVRNWAALADKGGAANLIQWLPIEQFVKAAQALIQMREQSKLMLYEQSGVSDIVRGQGDPNETATAQQIKGRFAGLRLGRDQRRFAHYALDAIDMMVDVALNHFDIETIIELANIDLPRTEMEREARLAMGETDVPETSWEAVDAFIRNDFRRRYSITIETDATMLTDEEEDRKARIEFLTAFVEMAQALVPIAGQAGIEFKMVKELLLFGVRGFRKARTLEGMIASLPDELPPSPEPPEPYQVTVAKIRAEVDRELGQLSGQVDLEEQRMENEGAVQREAVRAQTQAQSKGLDLMIEGERRARAAGQGARE